MVYVVPGARSVVSITTLVEVAVFSKLTKDNSLEDFWRRFIASVLAYGNSSLMCSTLRKCVSPAGISTLVSTSISL